MKHLFKKLSAFLVMLMCMSATVQAEIVKHEVCEPTASTRGFKRVCWEDTETGKYYSDADCTHELVDMELAQTVVYAKLPTNPIIETSQFDWSEHENDWSVDFNWAAVYQFIYAGNNWNTDHHTATFQAAYDNPSHARLVWNRNQMSNKNGQYIVYISVNHEMIYKRKQNNEEYEGVFVYSLPGLKQGDIVTFEVFQYAKAEYTSACPTFKASLEYEWHVHEYQGEWYVCDKCGYIKEHTHNYVNGTCTHCGLKHYDVCDATSSSRGFTRELWENPDMEGRFFADENCTQELVDEALAKAVVYKKLPTNPIINVSEFARSEHENDWSVDFNWAAVTTYDYPYYVLSSNPRSATFKVTNENPSSARLVWSRNQMSVKNGKYTVSIYVNNEVVFTRNQNNGEEFEGVFVQPLPELKQGDEVKFEVIQNIVATMTTANPTFKACLEYLFDCEHQYPDGSFICSKCHGVKDHEHSYVNHECTLCGAVEKGDIIGYVGTNADRKDIKWVLDENTHILTFTGTGAMEAFNLEHNAWRNENKTTVTKVVIGEGITSIGDGAYPNGYFIEMSGLTEVVLPSTLKTIGSSGFQDCINLTSITLPEGLETIKANGIRNCKEITSITLPSTLTSIGSTAFADCSGLRDMYIAGSEPITTSNDAFSYINRGNITLHVNGDLYDWAKATAPWSGFSIPRPYNIVYTDAEGVSHEVKFDTNAADNTWTLVDGCKRLVVLEDIPMQTLTYTRNFSAANTWQALYVPFEMAYSDWASKFDVAAITNFHEYTDENGVTEKVELEVRNVKNGKLHANTPYLIRAKAAGEQTIVLNDVTLQTTVSKSIDCRSTEREYTFTGTYEAIDGLQTKDYIFVSGGRLCKAGNDTDVLKPMRWYLTITERGSMTINPSPALAKPISIHVIGEDDTTGIEEITVVSSSLNVKASGIYSISGVKLAKPQQGINIINGKKVNVR